MDNFWDDENKEDELDLLAQNTMYPEAEDKVSASLQSEIDEAAGPVFAPESNMAPEEVAMPSAESQAAPSQVDRLSGLLSELQKQRSQRQNNINLARGGNQIAQAFAYGSGAKIGDGSEQLNALEKQLDQPIKDRKELIEGEMDEPTSDVSKLYRQQAYALLKKIAPNSDLDGKLENMSANQLMKLPGMKNAFGAGTQRADWIATDRVMANGHPVKFNKLTGAYHDGITGEVISPDQSIVRDIARRDAMTGQYGYVSRDGGMQVMPTNYGGVEVKPKADVQGVKQEYKFSDLNKAAPKVADDFTKLQTQFNKDMKESREVASSVTNMASKLKPGLNGQVDSGLLGGIQTQAAKMAGQKGVLTDQDLVKFAGAGGVAAKLARISENLQGNMSDSDVKFFQRFAQLMGKSLESDIQNRSQMYVDQGRQLVESVIPGIQNTDIQKWMAVDKVAPAVQDKAKSKTVKVQGPSGQIAEMTEENAAKYLKQPGYKLVK